jgi:hypothetical protein
MVRVRSTPASPSHWMDAVQASWRRPQGHLGRLGVRECGQPVHPGRSDSGNRGSGGHGGGRTRRSTSPCLSNGDSNRPFARTHAPSGSPGGVTSLPADRKAGAACESQADFISATTATPSGSAPAPRVASSQLPRASDHRSRLEIHHRGADLADLAAAGCRDRRLALAGALVDPERREDRGAKVAVELLAKSRSRDGAAAEVLQRSVRPVSGLSP